MEIDNLKLDYEVLQNNKIIIEKNFKKQIIAREFFRKTKINSLPFLTNRTINTDRESKKIKIDSILLQHREDMK